MLGNSILEGPPMYLDFRVQLYTIWNQRLLLDGEGEMS
jgi:hypothetical protein